MRRRICRCGAAVEENGCALLLPSENTRRRTRLSRRYPSLPVFRLQAKELVKSCVALQMRDDAPPPSNFHTSPNFHAIVINLREKFSRSEVFDNVWLRRVPRSVGYMRANFVTLAYRPGIYINDTIDCASVLKAEIFHTKWNRIERFHMCNYYMRVTSIAILC